MITASYRMALRAITALALTAAGCGVDGADQRPQDTADDGGARPQPDAATADASVGPSPIAGGRPPQLTNAPDDDDGGSADVDAGTSWLDPDLDAPWLGDVPEVCDGSQTIRLSFRITDDLSRFVPGQGTMFQNGVPYWLVTGECEFFVMVHSGFSVHQGSLTREQAQALGRRVHFGEGLKEDLYLPLGPIFDAGTGWLTAGDHSMGCYAACSAPAEVSDAFQEAFAISDELWALGTPMTGPIRIAVLGEPHSEPWTAIERLQLDVLDWPLASVTVDEVALTLSDYYDVPYANVLITDPGDLIILRELRERFYVRRQGESNALIAIDGGAGYHYFMYFRDVVPLENEDGFMRTVWTKTADGGVADAP